MYACETKPTATNYNNYLRQVFGFLYNIITSSCKHILIYMIWITRWTSIHSKTLNSLWILEISYKNELFYIKFAWNVNSKSWAVTKRYALYIIKFLRIKIFPQFSRKHHNWYPMLITHSRKDNTHSWRFQFVLLHLINKMSATILFL